MSLLLSEKVKDNNTVSELIMLFEAFLKPISTSLTTWMVSLGGIYNRHTVLLLHREEEKLKEMKYKVDI